MSRLFFIMQLLCSMVLFSEEVIRPAADINASVNQVLSFAEGHQTFKDVVFKEHEKEFVRLVEEGQNPQTLFIACSDSRIIPDLILGTKPGDLFVIRTAGNFVPIYAVTNFDGVSATIQYAVEILNVRHIIVCGHSHCGAIHGLFDPIDKERFAILKRWLSLGEDAKNLAVKAAKPEESREVLFSNAEQLSVVYQLSHLLSFPFIKKRVTEGSLELHGWYYRIESGDLSYYDPDDYRFIRLTEVLKRKILPVESVGAPVLVGASASR